MTYPDDADGDALRRIAATADMSRPMDIDFFIVQDRHRRLALRAAPTRRDHGA
jgi:hypothetical protein